MINKRWSNIDLAAIFSSAELERICSAQQPGRQHPFGSLLTEANPDPVVEATLAAFRKVLKANRSWLVALQPRLTNVSDFSESSSALAEIRAYGALLRAFVHVSPVQTSQSRRTPDFCVTLRSGRKVFVEIQAKQWDEKQSAAFRKFLSTSPPVSKRPGIVIREHVTAPFGAAAYKQKLGRYERITEQIVSRVCGTKTTDRQFGEDTVSVLWLDFQDVIWKRLGLEDHIHPIISWNGAITSGGFWNGFYGVRGLPLCENSTVSLAPIGDIVTMQHDGRFFIRDGQTGRPLNLATAIVLSFPEKTVIFETPLRSIPLPDEFILPAFQFPWFRIEDCWLNWPQYKLLRRVRNQHRVIRRIVNRARGALFSNWWQKNRGLLLEILGLTALALCLKGALERSAFFPAQREERQAD